MLKINNVTKKYGKFTALENINLEFQNGVYGLIAPNGAGKTTLMKMLATLSFPTQGEILYNGCNIVKLDEEYREIFGYLPQQFGYYRDYSPKQYLRYLASLKGMSKNDANSRIEELLSTVALTDVANKKMRNFSGGMLQRVGIAQALLNNPKILMLDEPTAGLDPKERVRFRNILSSLSKDKIVLLSTHIVSDVESIANKIIMIKDHRIFLDDSVENICNMLFGKVFEIEIDDIELLKFEEKYQVISQRRENGKISVRFINEELSLDSSRKVTPHLEDVFLYIYKEDI